MSEAVLESSVSVFPCAVAVLKEQNLSDEPPFYLLACGPSSLDSVNELWVLNWLTIAIHRAFTQHGFYAFFAYGSHCTCFVASCTLLAVSIES